MRFRFFSQDLSREAETTATTQPSSDLVQVLTDISLTLKQILKQLKILNLDPEYWEFKPLDVDKQLVIRRGETKTILDVKERGKLVALSAETNNPDVYLEIRLDDKPPIRGTPRSLYLTGLIGQNPRTFWLSRYDTENNIYVAWLTPVPPLDYTGHIKFIARAPPDSDVVFTYSIYRYCLRVKEEKEIFEVKGEEIAMKEGVFEIEGE